MHITSFLLIGITVILLICSIRESYGENYKFGTSHKRLTNAQVINKNVPKEKTFDENLPGNLANQIYYDRYIDSMTKSIDEKSNSSISKEKN